MVLRGWGGGSWEMLIIADEWGGLAIFILLFRNLGARIGCFD